MEFVPIGDAAAECGVSVEKFITSLCDSGLVLVAEWSEDCSEFLGHYPDCGCRFVPSPHPDIQQGRF
jgi:hypothetical protein